jgi:hypothetical protein
VIATTTTLATPSVSVGAVPPVIVVTVALGVVTAGEVGGSGRFQEGRTSTSSQEAGQVAGTQDGRTLTTIAQEGRSA